jgi:hypothetical protein
LNNCSHQRERERWVTTDYFGEETEGHWEYWSESATVDLDTHRYKCTMCGEVMYYSGAARKYYEEGIKSYVPGLDK